MIWVIIIGFLVGLIAKFLMPGRVPGGIVLTILLGIGGSMLANAAGVSFGLYVPGEPTGFIAAVLGAMAILFLYQLLLRKKNI